MITSEAPPAGGISRRVYGHSSYQRALMAIPAFLLAGVFVFAGSPAVAAAPSASADKTITITWDVPPPCWGDKPGPCPYYYVEQPFRQYTSIPGNQNITPQSSTPWQRRVE